MDILTNEQRHLILTRALVMFSELEERWTQLTDLFVAVENRIHLTLGKELDIFKTTATEEQLHKDAGKFLYDQVLRVTAETSLLRRISLNFVKLSNKYIMPVINEASGMLSADRATRQGLMQSLQTSLENGNGHIAQLMEKEKKHFLGELEKRKNDIK